MAECTFQSVWYLPDENKWQDMNPLAFRDVGILTIGERSLEFHGRSGAVHITHVKRISYGKQGRDFVNNWVRIEYGDSPAASTAFFADGSLLGWGGVLGGTKKLLAAVQHLPR
jgi:hypothetical protein